MKFDLVQTTKTIQDFLVELRKVAVDIISHKKIKDVQRVAIKEAKTIVMKSSSQLILHVDFAQNWAVQLQNEIQSAFWRKTHVSIFTAVCYYGQDKTNSYAVVSDDRKHDTSFALMAMNMIVEDLKEKALQNELSKIITVSDGATSQFKNRFQFYELRNSTMERTWLFSATGMERGPVMALAGS